ncbi:unnamed protein product [Dibothriocephalus latus]|uniref:Uncharacterized protein n=1 Tax=Dibothriocephalus latus TaxID=60516 RepID=A0A3P7NNE0_DIBLA|nr:unnamed protein product [Dibothriocephalus latus]
MSLFPVELASTFQTDTNVFLPQELCDDMPGRSFTVYPIPVVWATVKSITDQFYVTQHQRVGNFTTPDARFSHIHFDLVDRLSNSNDSAYLLTCKNRWPVVVLTPDISAVTVAKAFLTHWVSLLVFR